MDKRTQICLYKLETGHRAEEVTGNVDVVCRQTAPKHIRTGQKQTPRAGETRSPLSALLAFAPIADAMTENRVGPLFLCSFPAKKLVHDPKESTNQTRKAICYFQFLWTLVGERFVYKNTYIHTHIYICIYGARQGNEIIYMYTHIYSLYLPEFLAKG